MLTIQTLENIKRGSRLTFANGIYAILYGLLYLGFIKFIIKSDFRKAEAVWQVFIKYNPTIGSLYIKLMIIKGILIIALGIAILYLSMYVLKKKDKTAWVFLFLIGLVFWPALLTLEILNRNIYTITASFIGWLSFIIGMLIPLKYYLQREYSEY